MIPPSPPSAVLLLTPRWTRDGGVSAHVEASAAALAASGVQVSVAAARVEAQEPPPGVELIEAPRMFESSAGAEERIGEALARHHDVIHLHQVDDPDLVEGLRAIAPVLLSAHGYTACTSGVHYFRPGEECTRGHGPGCVPNLLVGGCAHTRHPKTLPKKYRNASRGLRALLAADLAISYSSAIDRHLATNGIAARAIVPYFPTMPARPGSGHAERRRVVFSGRIVPPKGVDVLLDAARQVDGEFRLCGAGRELEAMRGLARDLGIEDRVTFTGWLDAEQLAVELGEASVVVMPSVWPEPFGLLGIEAFAAGRPAVASMTGGVVDWLEHGVSGLGVPPADPPALAAALTQLLEDPARQERMGLAGRQCVDSRFSPERHVTALMSAYAAAQEVWSPGRYASV
jgi:glycosyltransferase involved in cell wall biosynthesis